MGYASSPETSPEYCYPPASFAQFVFDFLYLGQSGYPDSDGYTPSPPPQPQIYTALPNVLAPDSLLLESFNYEPPRWTPRIISPTPIRPCTDALQSTAKYLERLVEHGENARDLSDIDISLTQPIDLGSLSSERRAMSEPGSFSSENSDRLELGISQEHYSLSENSCNRSFTGYNHQLEDFPEYSPSQLFAVPDTRLNCLEVESVDQRCIGPFYFPQCTSPFLTSNPPTHSLTFDVCIPAPFYSLLGHVGHEVENQCMPGTLGIDVQ